MDQFNKKYKLIELYSLIAIDIACVLLSYLIAYRLRYHGMVAVRDVDITVGLMLVVFCSLFSLLTDWNHYFFQRGYLSELIAVLKYNLVMMIFVGCSMFLIKVAGDFSRLVFGYFAVLNTVLTYGAHLLYKKYMEKYYRYSVSSDKIMVVTTEGCLEELLKSIEQDMGWSYQVVAVAVLDRDMRRQVVRGIPVVACREDLTEQARQSAVDVAFVYLPHFDSREAAQIVMDFETMGITCHYGVDLLDINARGKSVGKFAGHLVVTYAPTFIDYRRRMIKRLIDLLGGLVGLLFTALITPFVAIAIKLDSRGPVVFSQTRVGRNGRRFKIYKFRSMYIDAEERKKELMQKNEMQGLMFKMEDDPRITRVGKFLRKTSIDELPQFINVLRGDMSLVGTRPPTEDEFEKYNNVYRRRLSITPGLTGMWQVSGRSSIKDFDEVVKLDLTYIDNWSLMLDFKILLQTVAVVLFGRGAK